VIKILKVFNFVKKIKFLKIREFFFKFAKEISSLF